MRTINKIIIHCTATPEGRPVTVKEVDVWHLARGFNGIGYHYLIGLKGEIWTGRDVKLIGAHTEGQNAHSIGVCYVGGLTGAGNAAKDTRTPEQKAALIELIKELRAKYPAATVHGHREFANKACPCFDAKNEYKDI
jgi:N-acetylmuramoyl-L-alanine amidase